jgi:hypothetical protein
LVNIKATVSSFAVDSCNFAGFAPIDFIIASLYITCRLIPKAKSLVILGTSTEFKIHQVIVNKNFATDLD